MEDLRLLGSAPGSPLHGEKQQCLAAKRPGAFDPDRHALRVGRPQAIRRTNDDNAFLPDEDLDPGAVRHVPRRDRSQNCSRDSVLND